jgi:hypothetical protein
MKKDTSTDILLDRVQQEKDLFAEKVEKVRLLLKQENALDLEDMILSGLEDFNVISSLPGSLNGRS